MSEIKTSNFFALNFYKKDLNNKYKKLKNKIKKGVKKNAHGKREDDPVNEKHDLHRYKARKRGRISAET